MRVSKQYMLVIKTDMLTLTRGCSFNGQYGHFTKYTLEKSPQAIVIICSWIRKLGPMGIDRDELKALAISEFIQLVPLIKYGLLFLPCISTTVFPIFRNQYRHMSKPGTYLSNTIKSWP